SPYARYRNFQHLRHFCDRQHLEVSRHIFQRAVQDRQLPRAFSTLASTQNLYESYRHTFSLFIISNARRVNFPRLNTRERHGDVGTNHGVPWCDMLHYVLRGGECRYNVPQVPMSTASDVTASK